MNYNEPKFSYKCTTKHCTTRRNSNTKLHSSDKLYSFECTNCKNKLVARMSKVRSQKIDIQESAARRAKIRYLEQKDD